MNILVFILYKRKKNHEESKTMITDWDSVLPDLKQKNFISPNDVFQ